MLAERWEDVLTSDVFGLLRYLPYTVMVEFLSRAISLERTPIPLDRQRVQRFTVEFWPKGKHWRRKPDAIVDLLSESREHIQRIIFEAKLAGGGGPYL
jgi:hypothetical protein